MRGVRVKWLRRAWRAEHGREPTREEWVRFKRAWVRAGRPLK